MRPRSDGWTKRKIWLGPPCPLHLWIRSVAVRETTIDRSRGICLGILVTPTRLTRGCADSITARPPANARWPRWLSGPARLRRPEPRRPPCDGRGRWRRSTSRSRDLQEPAGGGRATGGTAQAVQARLPPPPPLHH